jgi:hypothetical protein
MDLPNGKAVGFAKTSNEMFKYGTCSELVEYLYLLFTKMINEGHMPEHFNIGIIQPIVKDKNKDLNDVNNLRPITISDSLANIYERVLLNEINRYLPGSNKQFGFKKNSSCAHAVFCLREAALQCTKDKNEMFICSLDASKAFDKINRKFLWEKLKEKVPAKIVNTLSQYYDSSRAFVKTSKQESQMFKTTVGVKQGGPLSPKLFAIYLEELIKEIEAQKAGVKIGEFSLDIVLYADDIILLSTCSEELQKMVDTASDYGKKYEIKFNPEKTICMTISARRNPTKLSLKMDSQAIKIVHSFKYLGTKLASKMQNTEHVQSRMENTIKRCFMMERSGFNSTEISPHHKLSLYKVYGRPVLLYGLESLLLTQQELEKIQRTETNIIKRSLRISRRCRTTKLINALGIESMQNTIHRLKCNFMIRILKNPITHQIAQQLINLKKNSKSLMTEMTKINGIESMNTNELYSDTLISLNFLNDELRHSENGEQLSEIRSILDKYNYRSDAERLSTLLRAF